MSEAVQTSKIERGQPKETEQCWGKYFHSRNSPLIAICCCRFVGADCLFCNCDSSISALIWSILLCCSKPLFARSWLHLADVDGMI